MKLAGLIVAPLRHGWAIDGLALLLRVALAAPFWLSGRTKIEEGTLLTISETTYFLFENEYSGVPLPPALAAPMAATAEHLLPLLLLLGLGTRAAAAGLIAMTMVIQFFVYPDAWWNVHMQWVGLGVAVLVLGPGRWSLDSLLLRGRRHDPIG
jgi:putative oxidoreductase